MDAPLHVNLGSGCRVPYCWDFLPLQAYGVGYVDIVAVVIGRTSSPLDHLA